MKKYFTHCLALLLMFPAIQISAQIVTVTTGIPNSASSLGGTQAGMTFVIANNNSYAITIKSMAVYTAAVHSGATFWLKYTATNLSGPPVNPTTWTPVDTAVAGTITSTAINPVFTSMNFTIPANTTYRFLIHNTTSNFNYGGAATTPNSFTNGGVTIGTGNYTVSSRIVGYSGATPTYSSFSPRFWGGTITFEPAIANNVSAIGILSPGSNATFCYNEPVTVTARIQNKGSAPQSNFPVGAYYSSPAGSGNLNTLYTGTLAPGQIDTVVVGTFTPFASTYTLAAYTNMVNDSLRSDDTAQGLNFTMQGQVPLPNAVSDTVCAGMDAVVKVSSSNSNATFKWYSAIMGGTQLSTSDSILFAALPADTTMYVATVLGNCESDRVPISAAIGPPPVVNLGPDTSFCESIPLVLDAGNPGGTYRWSHGDSLQTTSISTVSGTYWVVVDKYCTASDTIDVTIRPMPYVSGISYVRMGNTYHFTPLICSERFKLSLDIR